MKAELIKYKNHLILLCALMVAVYITVPLWEYQQEQTSEFTLLKKQQQKIERLIGNKAYFEQRFDNIKQNINKVENYAFIQQSSSEFKLVAQQLFEKILTESNCKLERAGWEEPVIIIDSLYKWQLDARFKGNPSCVVNVTRKLEKMRPLISIEDFSYMARKIDGLPRNKISASLKLIFLQYPIGEDVTNSLGARNE